MTNIPFDRGAAILNPADRDFRFVIVIFDLSPPLTHTGIKYGGCSKTSLVHELEGKYVVLSMKKH